MTMVIQPTRFDLENYLTAPRNDIVADAPMAYKDQLLDLFYGKEANQGAVLPWPKTFDLLKFRRKETSLWCGYNGHGKSLVTTQVALDMAFSGEKVVIASFEMAPEQTLYRMVRQASRSGCPSISYIKAFLDWCEGRIWLLNKRGTIDPEYVVAAIRLCVEQHGCTQFFVDNLAKCVKGEDDFNGQKAFVDDVCSVALDTGAHVHLIHHLRKGLSEHEMPNKMDIKGSGAVVDQVDNAMIVWRNKPKERAMEHSLPDPKQLEKPDCVLNLCKQRNGTGREAMIGLWYAHDSMSYTEDKVSPSKRYDVAKDVGLI